MSHVAAAVPGGGVAPAATRGRGKEDAHELVLRWQRDRDSRALELLVEQFMPLARNLARRYGHSSIPMEDLVQVASLGLIKAIGRFDPERGVLLQSFAIPTILGELRRHFRDTGWAVHVARGAQERALAVREAQERLIGETGRSPTVDRLAEYLELSHEDVLEGLQVIRAYESDSLDTPAPGEEEQPLIETIGTTDEGYALAVEAAVVADALPVLSERQREVVRMCFFEELSQAEVGARIGVSQMQVSRTLRGALDALREHVEGLGGSERTSRGDDHNGRLRGAGANERPPCERRP